MTKIVIPRSQKKTKIALRRKKQNSISIRAARNREDLIRVWTKKVKTATKMPPKKPSKARIVY